MEFKLKRKVELKPIIERFHPNYLIGLTSEQIESRNTAGLINITKKGSSKTYLGIIINNLFTFFNGMYTVIFLLMLSAGTSLANFGFIIIMAVNTLIGIIQEIRSKRTIDKLSLLSTPHVKVVRNGEKVHVKIEELVLDDIMCLSSGNQITSDSILVQGEVEVNESQLTGESIPIRKASGDTLYSGSFIVSGNCYAQVERVGKDNEIEKLSDQARKYNKPKSEILKSLSYLLRFVSIVIIPIGLILYANAENIDLKNWDEIKLFFKKSPTYGDSIVTTSAALIGMIPAGLFLLTSVALAIGVLRLAKHKTLVQEIYCIEMLARVDVLCLDKTGTITDGSMTVTRFVEQRRNSEYNVQDIVSSMNTALQETNSTSKALEAYFGYGKKLTPTEIIPFSSDNKYSAVTFGEEGTYILGAPEFVLKSNYDRVAEEVNEYANQGLRVLALAHSTLPLKNSRIQRVPRIVALILIEDQIRREAYDTIKYFKDNGVEVKVISGDNPVTVSEVSKRVGIENAEDYISLDGLTDDDVARVANSYTVFGRVKPHQKKILVQSLKAAKRTVAMTGDGVNDILALKEADCSIAMASGSDAVRNVAQLVLLDSNFASMPKVVGEGRRVINNIQQTAMLYIVKTLFTFFTALLVITGFFKAFSPISFGGYPLESSQMLMIEMFVIGIPTFFLALQPNKNIVKGKFLVNVIQNSLPGSLTIVIEVIIAYMLSKALGFSSAQLVTVTVIVATATYLMILYWASKPFSFKKLLLFIFVSACCLFITVSSIEEVKIKDFNFREQFKLVPLIEPVYQLKEPYLKATTNDESYWFIGDESTNILNNDNVKKDYYLNEEGYWVIEDNVTNFKVDYQKKTSANALLLAICLTLSSYIIIFIVNNIFSWFRRQKPLSKLNNNIKP